MPILFCLLFFSLLTSQSLIDLSISVIFIVGLVSVIRKKDWLYPKVRPYAVPLLGLLAVVFVGLLPYFPAPEALKGLLEFRWIFELWFLVFAISQVRQWEKMFQFIFATLGISTLLALIFYFTGTNPALLLKSGHQAGESLAEPRLGGFFAHSMPFAHVYSMAFLLATGFFFNYRKNLSKKWQIIGGSALLFTFLSLIFSYSRGIWFAIAVAVVAAVIVTRNKSLIKALVMGGVLAGVVFATFPDLQNRLGTATQASAAGDEKRKVLLQANWKIFLDHPVVGIGYGYNKFRLREYYDKMGIPEGYFEAHAHNQYLQMLSGTGLLGLGFYLSFVLLVLFQNYKLLTITQALLERGILTGTLMAQICFLIGSLTEANFSIAKDRAMYLFIVSVFLAVRNQLTSSATLDSHQKSN